MFPVPERLFLHHYRSFSPLPICSSLLSVAVINHLDWKKSHEENVFHNMFSGTNSSLWKIKAETQGRAEALAMEDCCLQCCSPEFSYFSYIAQAHHHQGMVLLVVGWVNPQESAIKKMSPEICLQAIWWRQFFNWDSLFSVQQVDSKTNQDIQKQHQRY